MSTARATSPPGPGWALVKPRRLEKLPAPAGRAVTYPIWRYGYGYGSEAQKRAWLPRMASGEAIGAFALTEPEAGSNPAAMRASARRDGGDWILEGHKRWSTNATAADVIVVWARTEEGVAGFLVPAGTPGLAVRPIEGKLSLPASLSAEFTMDAVRLPADAVLPGVRGLAGPLSCPERGPLRGPVGAVGAALLALHLGRMKDAGTLRPEQVSAGKLNNVREALAIARQARTILAAEGITGAWPVMRHAANLESALTYEGTSEMHTLVVGRALTGLDAFS